MKYKNQIIFSLILVGVIVIAGCIGQKQVTPPTVETQPRINDTPTVTTKEGKTNREMSSGLMEAAKFLPSDTDDLLYGKTYSLDAYEGWVTTPVKVEWIVTSKIGKYGGRQDNTISIVKLKSDPTPGYLRSVLGADYATATVPESYGGIVIYREDGEYGPDYDHAYAIVDKKYLLLSDVETIKYSISISNGSETLKSKVDKYTAAVPVEDYYSVVLTYWGGLITSIKPKKAGFNSSGEVKAGIEKVGDYLGYANFLESALNKREIKYTKKDKGDFIIYEIPEMSFEDMKNTPLGLYNPIEDLSFQYPVEIR